MNQIKSTNQDFANQDNRNIIFDWDGGFLGDHHQSIVGNANILSYVRSYLDQQSNPMNKKHGKKVTYIDLFCGGGGLSLGVHHALSTFGFDARLLFACDKDKAALKLVDHHFKPMVKSHDAVENLIKYSVDLSGEHENFITFPQIKNQQIAQFKGKVDLLVGGPPCQGHSNLNNKTRRHDPRNLLYFIMPAFAVALDVPLIMIENVRSINRASENVVSITENLLQTNGYEVIETVLEGIDFGIAQTRKRHFLIASKLGRPNLKNAVNDLKRNCLSFDDVNSNLKKFKGLPKILETNSKLSEKNVDRINHLHDTNEITLENALRPVCHQDGHTYPSVYGRLEGDKPAGTITTGFSSPGRGRFIHPHEPRMITIREAARIQSFPDWYFKDVDYLKIARMGLVKIIGDAVPSLMVFPLIASLIQSIESIKSK